MRLASNASRLGRLAHFRERDRRALQFLHAHWQFISDALGDRMAQFQRGQRNDPLTY